MLQLDFDYAGCVRNSEKVSWKIDDVMPRGTRLDFGRTFLPEGLAQTWSIACLKNYQKLKLNQISANAYLNLFAFVEEFILATMVRSANDDMFSERGSVRALVRVAEEEAKHQELFLRYRQAFDRDFGHSCGVLENKKTVASFILTKSPMGVMMVILHIELFTQQHYLECVRDNAEIDPFFCSLLKNHFLEEAQHARVDALELDKLARAATPAAITSAFDDYLGILAAFDGLLEEQAQLDVKSLAAASGVAFSEIDVQAIIRSQRRAYRKTFLIYGMTNPQFVSYLGQLSPVGQARVKEATALYEGEIAASSPVPSTSTSPSSSRNATRLLPTAIAKSGISETAIDIPRPSDAELAPSPGPRSSSVKAPRPLPSSEPEVTMRAPPPQPPDLARPLAALKSQPSTTRPSPPSGSVTDLPKPQGDGSLVIEVPVDATVFVNGVERGRGPQRVDGLDRNGKVVVRILCPGHTPWSGSVNLEGKPAAKIRPSLKRAGP